MFNFLHAIFDHTLVICACSQFCFISGLSANIGGSVISCDSEDTNHLGKEENGREREERKGGEGQGRERDGRWKKCKGGTMGGADLYGLHVTM